MRRARSGAVGYARCPPPCCKALVDAAQGFRRGSTSPRGLSADVVERPMYTDTPSAIDTTVEIGKIESSQAAKRTIVTLRSPKPGALAAGKRAHAVVQGCGWGPEHAVDAPIAAKPPRLRGGRRVSLHLVPADWPQLRQLVQLGHSAHGAGSCGRARLTRARNRSLRERRRTAAVSLGTVALK